MCRVSGLVLSNANKRRRMRFDSPEFHPISKFCLTSGGERVKDGVFSLKKERKKERKKEVSLFGIRRAL